MHARSPLIAGTLAFGMLAGHALAQPPAAPPGQAPAVDGPRIEVVFVLDTTGSMGGLIEGAKQKIWSIAGHMATAEPAPHVRMGLVAYRDRGDDYVTLRTDLTDDLDALYADLMGYVAAGGGDGPESVNQALHEAVDAFAWSPDDEDVLRLIYLVGDAPPHMGYADDVTYTDTTALAAELGLVVNTIQCGQSSETARVWQAIAQSTEGDYFQIDQSGGTVAVSTPYDAELAALNAELGQTMYAYGDGAARATFEARRGRAGGLDAAAAPEALADRAAYNQTAAGRRNLYGEQELVRDVVEGTVALEEIAPGELPDDMRDMTPAERAEHVERVAAERDALNARIQELVGQRLAYLRTRSEADGDGFDGRVFESLRRQASGRGFAIGKDAGRRTD